MTKLIATRGLPGSGKTTKAKDWVQADPATRARINRDDLRDMLHDGIYDHDSGTERQICTVRDAAIKALLRSGKNVVVDETNLPNRSIRDLMELAAVCGAEFEVWDLTDVPLDVCLQRNEARGMAGGNLVPPTWIVEKHQRFIAGKPHPLPIIGGPDAAVGRPYVRDRRARLELDGAIIVDIDGTVALKGDRSPYDETRVSEDKPNYPVTAAVWALYERGYKVIFCSGRTEACREDTEAWIRDNIGTYTFELYMRAIGDKRRDDLVKLELFDKFRDRFDICAVFDDRQQVVDMWRSLGLTVFQVAPGDF